MLIGTGWDAYLGMLAEIVSVAMLLAVGIVLSWVVGREFAEGTVGALLALPTSPRQTLRAKLVVTLVWALGCGLAAAIVAIPGGLAIGLGAPDAGALRATGRLLRGVGPHDDARPSARLGRDGAARVPVRDLDAAGDRRDHADRHRGGRRRVVPLRRAVAVGRDGRGRRGCRDHAGAAGCSRSRWAWPARGPPRTAGRPPSWCDLCPRRPSTCREAASWPTHPA